eukprot:Gregarina_sp_Pseudo_9__962@NODE_1617_length_1451_cov_17_627479_g1499_i0_p1_GENE_NODE_1617_length_1451_cov_17_627479_g1499_i0NODE_1617_length_1451_cov_17_627479_g1499_i0_p1_ORF_typecomplete_len287_score39_88_NODE_1617_length_1451_cov_17_627479_g1499_i03131173
MRLILLSQVWWAVVAFNYHGGCGPMPNYRWDIWKEQREILIDCDRVAFVPEKDNEKVHAVEVCSDICETSCGDPKTLKEMASCLGRLDLLACQFGYSELKSFDVLPHWCVDRLLHMHMFINDSTLVPTLRAESYLQVKMYLDIDASLDEACREGNAAVMSIAAPKAGETWPVLGEAVKCPDPLWENAQHRAYQGHMAPLQLSDFHQRIVFRVHPSDLDLIHSLNGSVHLDFAFSACIEGARHPPAFSQAAWGGFVIEIPHPITSFRSLYSKDQDSQFWQWKGPFAH